MKKVKIKRKKNKLTEKLPTEKKSMYFTDEEVAAMERANVTMKVKAIANDPEKLFQFCAKSTFDPDDLSVMKKVNDIMEKKETKNYQIDPESMCGIPEDDYDDWGPITTPEQDEAIENLYKKIRPAQSPFDGSGYTYGFDPASPWIQTYTGRRFNPTNPNPDSIVLQDIAHALSMQCRFSGHCQKFYSVAQHSVLVSYICDEEDALWGLLHDSGEAFLVDLPRPLKHSGKFQAYIDFETVMQQAICQRFNLPEEEPSSVKRADKILLATEARDLMSPTHPDWKQPADPLPFIIQSWTPEKAEQEFLNRFEALTHPK